MRTVFLAIWYNPAKVEARAKAMGWNEAEGSLLDTYHPDEDPRGHEQLACRDLKSAETHLRNIIANGNEFWGQASIREFEVDGPRCRYCVCNGWRLVREYAVDDTGIVDSSPFDQCLEDED